MNQLVRIARSATPGSGVQFRRHAYGQDGIRAFLRDVLALANAAVEGNRYLVVGVGIDAVGRKQNHTVPDEEFSGKPSYQALANEYIEPPIRLQYTPISVDGTRVGVFEIGDCQDRPYMMRIDFDEGLRRGDAYKRVNDAAVKMGRRQLMELFERKFRDAVSAGDIEIGFPGEIIHKEITLPTCNLFELPSALASRKLEEMLRIRNKSLNFGSTTMVARLAHARLFGTDNPYEHRSPEEIRAELSEISSKFHNEDANFLFREQAQELQLVAYNQGEDALVDASLTLVLPSHGSFHVADSLPRRLVNDRFIDRTPIEIGQYPAVTLRDDAVQVCCSIGDLPAGEPVDVFRTPLRMCAGSELAGRRFGLRYSLHAQNLRAPARGRLKVHFS